MSAADELDLDLGRVTYEYDARQWCRGEAWAHLWEAYLNSAQHIPNRNPMRKAHQWVADDDGQDGHVRTWRWIGPLLTPREATESATTPRHATESATTPRDATESATTPRDATESVTTPRDATEWRFT